MLEIDGSLGEGGGQVLRSSLSLSMATGRPFRITRIRAGRSDPGLGNQHLAAVEAAAAVSRGEVEGAGRGARELVFRPGRIRPGRYAFGTGTAASATLVLLTLLPPLLTAEAPSELRLEGGTHNPSAPPFDFVDRTLLPLVNRMGPRVRMELERHGFYPRGGGRMRVRVEPTSELEELVLMERGPLRRRRARALVADLPRHIAEREASVAHAMLGLRPDAMEVVELPEGRGPGNVLLLELESRQVTEVFTGFGRKGVPAEEVAREACREALDYQAAGVPVGPHLADQLLLPLALAGGRFRTVEPTGHTRTQLTVVERFLSVTTGAAERSDGSWMIEVTPRG